MEEVIGEFLKNKTKESFNTLIEWCSNNYDKIDFKDNKNKTAFEAATYNLMKYKKGHLTENEAEMLINYYAREYAFEKFF